MSLPPCVRAVSTGHHLALKVVPGARRDAVVGLLGDRLKVAVRAPPEDGRANRAVCRVVADWLGVDQNRIELAAGAREARKTLLVKGPLDWPGG